jgi:hypothetical protein
MHAGPAVCRACGPQVLKPRHPGMRNAHVPPALLIKFAAKLQVSHNSFFYSFSAHKYTGVFSIRPPRGKSAAERQPSPPQEILDEHSRLVSELKGTVAQLRETCAAMQAAYREENQKLATRVATLELQYRRMKLKGRQPVA